MCVINCYKSGHIESGFGQLESVYVCVCVCVCVFARVRARVHVHCLQIRALRSTMLKEDFRYSIPFT